MGDGRLWPSTRDNARAVPLVRCVAASESIGWLKGKAGRHGWRKSSANQPPSWRQMWSATPAYTREGA